MPRGAPASRIPCMNMRTTRGRRCARAGAGYALEAVEALGIDAGRVFKTIVVAVDGRLGVAVVPADAEVDLKAVADALGGRRAAIAPPAEAEKATGYVLGGISPLGTRRPLPTVVDASAAEWPTIHVSAGRRGLEIELAPADLVGARAAGRWRRSHGGADARDPTRGRGPVTPARSRSAPSRARRPAAREAQPRERHQDRRGGVQRCPELRPVARSPSPLARRHHGARRGERAAT